MTHLPLAQEKVPAYLHGTAKFLVSLPQMCKGDGSVRTSNDDDNIALLSQLKRTNPEKFKR